MNTKIPMLAITALAILSFSFAPAFAANYASAEATAPSSGWASSSMDDVSCGNASGDCVAKAEVSASQDKAKFWYGIQGSQTTCTVSTQITGLGAVINISHGTIAGLHTVEYSQSIDSGDRVVITNTYTNCS